MADSRAQQPDTGHTAIGVGHLFEVATESVRAADAEVRLTNSDAALQLASAARIWFGAVTLYGERLKLQGAQLGECPPRER